MHKIWFERPMLPQFSSMLGGIAEAIGASADDTADPLDSLEDAEAVIASGWVYDAVLMDKAPQLKIISRTGIGYDKVDISAANARGIVLVNAPDGPTISTAEQAVTLIMSVAKNVKQSERKLRQNRDQDFYGAHEAIELYGKQLGLVGFGRIARHVAAIAQALGMQVAALDPYIDKEIGRNMGVAMPNKLGELLAMSDVVSLHIPATPDTHKLFDAERFAQMKPGAIFVNTARGSLVDEAALLTALQSGQLFGAGLDVTDPEPPFGDNPLLQREDVIVTPHVASGTRDGKARIFETALRQAIEFLKYGDTTNIVNPEALQNRK